MEKPAQWALVGAAWFLALTVALTAYLAWRHFDGAAAATTPQGAQAPLAVGEKTLCPVTHEALTIGPDTPQVIYKDRVYYFSTTLDAAGQSPKRRFLMDPEFYAHPGAEPLQALAPAAAAAAAPPLLPTAIPTPVPQPTALPTKIPAAAAKP